MIITLRKTAVGGHRVTARRADGVSVFVDASDHPHRVPHELAHYAIERELGLEWGFWGCVSRGALFRGMTVLDGMAEGAAAELSAEVRGRAGSRFDSAEVLVAALEEVFAHHRDLMPQAKRDKMVELQPVLADAPLQRLDLDRLAAIVDEAARTWGELPRDAQVDVVWSPAPSAVDAPGGRS